MCGTYGLAWPFGKCNMNCSYREKGQMTAYLEGCVDRYLERTRAERERKEQKKMMDKLAKQGGPLGATPKKKPKKPKL